jgi:hypothetical protein
VFHDELHPNRKFAPRRRAWLTTVAVVIAAAMPVAAATAAEVDTLIAEIFDGDGDLTADAGGGTVPGTSALDANEDARIDAADLPAILRRPPGVLFDGSAAERAPHHLGDVFVYATQSPDGSATERFEIIAVDGDRVQLERREGSARDLTTLSDMGAEVFILEQVSLVDRTRVSCVPAVLQLSTPVVAGRSWGTTSSCEVRSLTGSTFLGRFQQTSTVTPLGTTGEVVVPAGTFTGAQHFNGITVVDSDGDVDEERTESWLVPGIGVVRDVTQLPGGGTRIRELTEATIAGRSAGGIR